MGQALPPKILGGHRPPWPPLFLLLCWILTLSPFGICWLDLHEDRYSRCALALTSAMVIFLYSFLRVKSLSAVLVGSLSIGFWSDLWFGVRIELRSSSSSMRRISSSSGVGGMVVIEAVAGGLGVTRAANPLLAALWRGGLGPVAALLTLRAVPLPSCPILGLAECLDIDQMKAPINKKFFTARNEMKQKLTNVSHNRSMLRQDLKKWRVLVSLYTKSNTWFILCNADWSLLN